MEIPLPVPDAPDHRARLAVLAAVRRHDDLARDYVLKGGLVLQHIYGSPRPSSDLDFNHAEAQPNELSDAHTRTLRDVCDRVDTALRETAPAFGLEAARLHVVKWSALLPTVFAEAAFRADDGTTGGVEVQVTLCEKVCHTAAGRIGGVPVQVSTLDDVVADKLKVLLQQRRRHKVRHSDVFDLWFALARAPFVPDPATVRAALLAKLASWPEYLPLRAAAFRDPGVRAFAEQGYRALRADEPALPFAPFDVVWGTIGAFVEAMDLDAAA